MDSVRVKSSEFGRWVLTGFRARNWGDLQAGLTFGNASGSALKSMTQRLCSVVDPAGSGTSWLRPAGAGLPHSVGRFSESFLYGVWDRAFPA